MERQAVQVDYPGGILKKIVRNAQGVFTLTYNSRQWEPTERVYRFANSGVIRWFMKHPRGILYVYPDGIKRFVNDSWSKVSLV